MSRSIALLLWAMLAGCSVGQDLPETGDQEDFSFDFRDGPQGWATGFADYPAGEDAFFELAAGYDTLPPEVGSGSALHLSGNNHSDDLFMFIKRRIDGLNPNQTYALRFDVEIASNAASGCVGIGGAPGESVTLKAGASTIEPIADNHDGFLEMNVDKGNQASGGANALVLGDIANGRSCDDPPMYVLKSLDSGDQTLQVTTDAAGGFWLFAGTDSGFEGTTSLYYTRFEATIVD
jgi:hypothetical protein